MVDLSKLVCFLYQKLQVPCQMEKVNLLLISIFLVSFMTMTLVCRAILSKYFVYKRFRIQNQKRRHFSTKFFFAIRDILQNRIDDN